MPDPEAPNDLENLRHALTRGPLQDDPNAAALLVHFELADEGDDVARDDLVAYLAHQEVAARLASLSACGGD